MSFAFILIQHLAVRALSKYFIFNITSLTYFILHYTTFFYFRL